MSEFIVSFRVMGENLDPGSVSRALGVEPTESHKAGSERPSSGGRKYSPFREGIWCLTSTLGEKATLDEHLDELLSCLSSRRPALNALKNQGFRQDIFVGVFSSDGNTGFTVSTSIETRLLQLGLKLNFDIYS